ncbi:MAG TPA: helix-turn-helix transcriptional regulator [Microthrixaceae bacterium]|nr:helix-turn-helix transcriptional regulator [Microthrixaceae bacterium]
MDASGVLKLVRQRSGLSLRSLARRAGTSHATLSAYEAARVVPSVETLDRIVNAAGFDLQVSLEPKVDELTGSRLRGREARGLELVEVLELAGMFPARHSPTLEAPIFGRTSRHPTAE